ncbi:MAG: accessory gene regulator B family protein [Ruminococcus sp.]|nr:accessory gene regulator B family protein [Ruminococcus sp.]
MFRNLAEDIAFWLIVHKIVKIEERDTYIYGIEVILLNGGLLLLFLLISLLFSAMINFWAYLIFFLPLRIFSGGYHAKTSECCFILSTIMYGFSVAVAKLLPLLYTDFYWWTAGTVSIFTILIFAPLINANNPLNEVQKKRNRIIVYSLIITDLVFFILCCIFNWKIATHEMIFITFDAVLLIIGKISHYISNNENQ